MSSPYVQLLRPANVATAAADVVAGFAVAGAAHPRALPWLIAASVCLYGGGVVLNDFFDRDLDARERPERPIPSGRVAASSAARLGAALLGIGPLVAFAAAPQAGVVAAALAAAILLYDAAAKRSALAGPIVMGSCRGLNLMLGMATSPSGLSSYWTLSLLPLAYIAAITLVSRGEVTGGRRRTVAASLVLIVATLAILATLAAGARSNAVIALALVLALAWRVLPPLWRAYARPDAVTIRTAVRRGVLSLVLLDAVLAAAYAGAGYALAVLATGLLAGYLARFFAVT